MPQKIYAIGDRHNESHAVTQREFPFGQPSREQAPISAALVARQPSLLAAIQLAQTVSGLDDKQVYGALGIDHAQWSRIRTGQANFPINQLVEFMTLCGNHVPLEWLAAQCGYELRPLLDTKDRQIEALKAELAEVRRENHVMQKLWRETR